MKITSNSIQGPRDYQEDRLVVFSEPEAHLLAVFDGHGGDEAASLCQDFLVRVYKEFKFWHPKAMMGAIFKALNEITKFCESGTTASIVYTTKRTATVGVVGDSPVVILDSMGNYVNSPEHNVRSNYVEVTNCQRRGGIYNNGYIYAPVSGAGPYAKSLTGGLQLSRALGDCEFGKVVSKQPEIYEVSMGPESYVLVASDGLVDPGHTDTSSILKTIKKAIEDEATAKDLVSMSIQRGTYDNVTAILARNDFKVRVIEFAVNKSGQELALAAA